MTNTIRSLVLFLSALAMMGCPSRGPDSSPANGGVDGSGGDLAKIKSEEFDKYIKQDHPYYVRDVIDRLYWIKEKSPQDFKKSASLSGRFLNENRDEMNKLVESLVYTSASDGCHSQTEGESHITDAAVSGHKVCLSYGAFKNLSEAELKKQLIIIAMHEISHLRGFNEAEARLWQDQFEDYRELSHTILVYNEGYKTLREALEKVSYGLRNGLFYFLNRDSEYNQNACYSIRSSYEHADKLISGRFSVPSVLRKKIDAQHQLVLALGMNCSSQKEDVKNLTIRTTEALKNMDEIIDLLRTYESRFCSEYNCREDVDDTHTPKSPLLLWNSFKDLYLENLPYNEVSLKDVKCELLNVKTQTSQTLKFYFQDYPDGYSYGFARVKLPTPDREINIQISYQGINVFPIHAKNAVIIDVDYLGNERVSANKNFTISGFGLLGVLDKNLLNEAEIQFEFTDAPLRTYNYYYETQRTAPVFPNQYKLTCKIDSAI